MTMTTEALEKIRQRAGDATHCARARAAAAIAALDSSVLAVLRRFTLEQHGLVDDAMLSQLSPEARERSITGAMVSCLVDLCGGDRTVARR